MPRFSKQTRLTLTLLCVVMVALRIAGAHLHLCFDGSEPPVSLHVADAGGHHDGELAGITHSDRDVSVSGDYLSKKLGGSADLAALTLCLALLLFFVPRLRAPLPRYLFPRAARPVRFHGLPPPRGPPRPV